MAKCEVCGNDYDKSFSVMTSDGRQHVFDSFECAIHAVAPTCAHCQCKIIGHGIEHEGAMYCCESCVRHTAMHGAEGRAELMVDA